MKKIVKEHNKKRIALVISLCISAVLFSGCTPMQLMQQAINDRLEQAVVGETQQVSSVSTDRYAYQQLQAEEQQVYDQILDCVMQHTDCVAVSTKDEKALEKAYECVMADYGELFWFSGYQYNTYSNFDQIIGLEFMPTYIYTEQEREELQQQVDMVADAWLAEVPADASDYEKAKLVYETLIEQVDYDTKSENNQNILSVFIGKKTVCQGYADATQYLLHQLGIPAIVVTGTAGGENHAWNLVNLDGEYYYIDTTWGNTHFLGEWQGAKKIDYGYLNARTQDLAQTHTAQMPFAMPACESVVDNYFYQEGLYFETADMAVIGKKVTQEYLQGEKEICLRMSNLQDYLQVKEHLIDKEEVFRYCNGAREITYFENQALCILTILL